jgi:hypothetical protein
MYYIYRLNDIINTLEIEIQAYNRFNGYVENSIKYNNYLLDRYKFIDELERE